MVNKNVGFDKAKLIIEINQKAENLFGGLKHSSFSEYLDKISQMHIDNDLEASVIIITEIHEKKKELIESILKEKRFKINTQVRVFFTNGEELAAQYTKKKNTKKKSF